MKKRRLLGVVLSICMMAALSACCFSHEWLEATCLAPKICMKCRQTEGEALGHAWKEATCEEAKVCTACGETEGEALGHSVLEWVTEKEPTCTAVGIMAGNCSICGKSTTKEVTKIAHMPGEWTVVKNPTQSEPGKREKLCTVCGETTEAETFELSAEEIEANYKASCGSYSYNEIARNPDAYQGKYAKFTGKVIQVQQEELYGMLYYVLRVNVTKGRYGYDDTVYVTYVAGEKESRILDDDIITMYGELTGEKTYTTVMGASITIPSFTARYLDIN